MAVPGHVRVRECAGTGRVGTGCTQGRVPWVPSLPWYPPPYHLRDPGYQGPSSQGPSSQAAAGRGGGCPGRPNGASQDNRREARQGRAQTVDSGNNQPELTSGAA